MMGLGYWSSGGPSPYPSSAAAAASSAAAAASSSSSSSLSASAPPFTVERFSLRPPPPFPPSSSNPSLHFSDPQPYDAHPSWQYSNPSPPHTTMPPLYQKTSGLDLDSTVSITSVPLGSDYRFGYSVPQSIGDPQTTHWSPVNPCSKSSSSSATFSYDAEVESYYPPYASSVVDHDSPLLGLTEPSYDMLLSSGSSNVPCHVDYTRSLSGLEYSPERHNGWNALLDAKRGKQAELGRGFPLNVSNAADPLANGNHMNQGYYTVGYGEILEKDSSISFGEFSNVNTRECNIGFTRMEPVDNASLLAQKIPSAPFDSLRTVSNSCFQIPTSDSPGSSLQSPFMTFQKSWNTHEKCILPCVSSITDPLSVTKSSPALVIRPPVTQKAASAKTVDTGKTAAIHAKGGLGIGCSAKGKEHQMLFDYGFEQGSLFSSELKYQKEGNGQRLFVPSAVTEELSSKLQTLDGVNNISKLNSGSQVPSISVSDGSSLSGDCFQAVKSSDNVADSLDHHSFAVDSPCWKGAPASHFSPLDIVEAEKTHPFVKRIDKYCELDLQVDKGFSLPNDPIKCSSGKAGDYQVHEHDSEVRDRSCIPGNISEADYTAREMKSVDAVKTARFEGPILRSEGAQFCEEYNKATEDYDVQPPSGNGSDLKSSGIKQPGVEDFTPSVLNFHSSTMDSLLNTSIITEGSVAVRAAENVLCSPASEGGVAEQAKQIGHKLAPMMDVQLVVKALQNLSDLLVFNSLTDASSLKDEDLEALKHVMCNLDALVSRKIGYFIHPQEWVFRQQVSGHKTQSSLDSHVSNSADGHQMENEAGRRSHCHLDYQTTNDETGIHNVTNEFEKFQLLSPGIDDLDVLRDDNMAQAIKKVLEENLHCGEEMESQALLLKNLWLEAEAKLCSISYRARFDRMKIEMEKLKSNRRKENAAAIENTSISTSPHDLIMSDVAPPMVENASIQKSTICRPSLRPTSNSDDIEASVETSFHILKCRDDSKSQKFLRQGTGMVEDLSSDEIPFLKYQLLDRRLIVTMMPHFPKKIDVNQGYVGLYIGWSESGPGKDDLSLDSNINDVDASIMTRFNILKCRDDTKVTNLVGKQAGLLDTEHPNVMPFNKDQLEDNRLNLAVEPHFFKTGGVNQGHVSFHVNSSGRESLQHFSPPVADVPVNQFSAAHGQKNHVSLGFNDNCSSDWEHVLKDDIAWH